jgi:hypothetical protein
MIPLAEEQAVTGRLVPVLASFMLQCTIDFEATETFPRLSGRPAVRRALFLGPRRKRDTQ